IEEEIIEEEIIEEEIIKEEIIEEEVIEDEIIDKVTQEQEIATKSIVVPIKQTDSKRTVVKKKEVTRTKADMIAYLVDHTELNKNKSNKFLKFFAEVVKESLASNEDVDLPDFGLFTTIDMPAKEAMNPQTNEIMLVEAHKQVRFRFADSFKDIFKDLPVEEDNDEDLLETVEEKAEEMTEESVEETGSDEISADPEALDENQEMDELVKVDEPIKKVHKPVIAPVKVITRTKADIISYLESNTDLNKNKSNKFLKFFAEVIKESLSTNQDVELPGFGLFTTIDMPAKEAMNPQTNKIMLVDAHKQVRLRFDEEFKNIFKDIDVLTVTQLSLEIDEELEDEQDADEEIETKETFEEPVKENPPKVQVSPKSKKESKKTVIESPKKQKNAPKIGQTKTKADIINFLEANSDLNKNKSNKFLKSFAGVIKDALANHEDVELPGFGLFTTIDMPAKEAMNPQTNEIMLVDAHRQVRLRFDDEFKNVFKD
ncbi:MAG: HU family DNA-binding protein, partial [Firmicutes bacterium]|nr:HU family DNA-binding protein [Bacillota bacterium]